jgi:N-acetylglutamate synthase-like GNAT family acetyltransferase
LSITGDILLASSPAVRGARAEDHDRVEALAAKLGNDNSPKEAVFRRSFLEVLADAPRTLVHVAEVEGNVVGYALTTINTLLYTHGASAQLQEIVVDDSVQTSGVGTALVRAVEKACEEYGVTQLTVASRRAGGFYDRLGYTQQAEYMRRLF